MASIGDEFTTCPDGFQRFVYNQSKKDLFFMNNMNYVRSWGVFGTSSDSSVTFYLKGASEVRCISLIESTCGVGKVYVNDIEYGEYYSTFTNTEYSDKKMGYHLVSAIIFPNTEYTKIKLYNNGSRQINFEGIDIPLGAELITEEQYLEGKRVNFLLKVGDVYKTYNESTNTLDDVPDISLLDKTSLTGVSSELIQNALGLLPSLNNVKLILGKNVGCNLKALKRLNELVVMKTDFFTPHIKSINYVSLDNVGEAKLVFSTDGGNTWKTYSNDEWVDISITLPKKDYKDMTEEDKVLCDNATSEILNEGISSEIISTLDFSSLNIDKIRFAIVVSCSTSDEVSIRNITCNAQSEDYYKGCSELEIERALIGNTVLLKSNITAQSLKVSICTVGVTENASTMIDGMSQEDINKLKQKRGI